jgi:hypothetical protein
MLRYVGHGKTTLMGNPIELPVFRDKKLMRGKDYTAGIKAKNARMDKQLVNEKEKESV